MTLLRNDKNTVVAVDRQVMISFEDDPKIGKGVGLFGSDWHTVGWLADGSNVTFTREVETIEVAVSGGGTRFTIRKPGIASATFEIADDNEISRKIAYPTETPEGVRFNDAERLYAHLAFVFIKRDKENKKRVEIAATRYKAALSMDEISEGQELEGKEVTVEFAKGAQNDFLDVDYFELKGDELVRVEPIRFVEASNINGPEKVDVLGNLTTVTPADTPADETAGIDTTTDTGDVTTEGETV